MEDRPREQGYNWVFVTEASKATAELQRFSGAEVIGLDTETCWEGRGGGAPTCVSLIQLANRAGEVVIIDALAAGTEMVRELVESPDLLKVAHNARFDEGVLRSAGLRSSGFLDTLQLSRAALDLPSYTLKSVVAHLFGLELDKSFQKSNWRRRPLSREQLEYAALDAHITLRLYDELRHTLEEEGRWEWARRAATLTARPAGGEPRKRRTIKLPPLVLTPAEQRVVARLKEWRFKRAREMRVPAYMVCPDRTLEHLTRARPETVEALEEIHGLGATKIERFGAELLAQLREACSSEMI